MVARPQPSHQWIRQDPIPLLKEKILMASNPPPRKNPENEESNGEDQAPSKIAQYVFDTAEVPAKDKAKQAKYDRPAYAPERVVQRECQVRHMSDAGEECNIGAEDADKT